ncbi:tripartite tricarboxylate transporter TctB family protein [Pseudodonghicola xiamenensis]|uniref:Membrane protein n=1 Tax=Pseudodonghicola xiamenensis TaxID=337702 RepID=A0A8J3H4K1_9RHOB|nr:tripartite tricarboxylate transporter TctB family protein [Pseudodonghicola xiamenensis]GHG79616.1 membrane protein [Pseudodonghicola xiamenensis]
MSDRIFGIFGILLAVGFAIAALSIEESFLSDAVGPKAFPLIIAAILGLSSALIALRPDPEPRWPSLLRLAEISAAVVVMILYAQLLPVVGFIVATACAATYLTWRLGSSLPGAVITGISTSIGIYVVFHLVLGLSLARGPLGF